MPTTYKILGQNAPTALTNTTLYTVPSANSTVCSTLVICNRGESTNYRVSVIPSGESLLEKHYIIYDNYINASDTIFLTLGMTLAHSDVVSIYAGTSNTSFSLFGSEIS